MNRNLTIRLTILTLIIISMTTSAQTIYKNKPLTEKIGDIYFLEITINHLAENYRRTEISVIYHHDNTFKIHSILNSNSLSGKQIDTVFTLNKLQLSKLDKFGFDFDKKTIPTGLIIAGSRSIFTLTLNGQTSILKNKSDYSLVLDLLKN